VAYDGSSSSGAVSYDWKFGDGAVSSGSQTEHTFATAGVYTSTLTVIDSKGHIHTKSVIITVAEDPAGNTPPAAVIEASATTGTVPLNVSFTGSGSHDSEGPILVYLWNFGDGSPTATGSTTSHQYTVEGNYNASLRVTDSHGTTDTVSTLIVVTGPQSESQDPAAINNEITGVKIDLEFYGAKIINIVPSGRKRKVLPVGREQLANVNNNDTGGGRQQGIVSSIPEEIVDSKLDEPFKDALKNNFGRYYALVIGNQKYKHLSQLRTPVADAKAVANILEEQYNFTVELLINADREQMLRAISGLRKNMTKEKSNLLIYYAGHGYLDKVRDAGYGYWQPVDAEADNDVNWIPTSRITNLLKVLLARHVIVVSDSCYSGSFLMRDSGAQLSVSMTERAWLQRLFSRRSRTVLTSGSEEPVLDSGGGVHSIFANAFLQVLRENQEILDGDTLFDRIKRPIVLNSLQIPMYGDIRMTGHEGGGIFYSYQKKFKGWNILLVSRVQ